MGRRNRQRIRDSKIAVTPTQAPPSQTIDSFQNFAARMGIGTGNMTDGATYGFNPITRNRVQLEWAYRGSWIVGQAVDCIADHMTREGVEVQSDSDPEELAQLDQEIVRLQVWPALCDTIRWSRLYGGALAYIMIDGQNPATPLRIETIRKDQFKGLLPMDRWSLQPSLNDLISDLGPSFGTPKFYSTTTIGASGLPSAKIHHSRVLRFDGISLPYWQRITENLWGISVIERLWDRLIAFDSVTAGTAQLVYKAYLRTYKVDGLRDIIAAGGPAMEGLAAQMDLVRKYQSSEGLTLMDAKDEFEAHSYSFGGISDVMLQFAQQLAGSLQTPLVRLFGMSPAGLNSTGESDLAMYDDTIKQKQETHLRHAVETIYRLTHLSKFGTPLDENAKFEFRPLRQMTEEQRAAVTVQRTGAITQAYESQLIDRATGMRELKNMGKETGTFNTITDEAIKEAESDPVPSPEMLGLVSPPVDNGPEAQGSGSGKDGKSRAPVRAVS